MGDIRSRLKIVILVSLFLVSVTTRSVFALTVLPDSDIYDGKMKYSNLTLEFAVYDSTTQNGQAFESAFGTAPGTGQYIYAYQLFTTFDVTFFAVYDTEGASWSADGGNDNNIGALNDGQGGIEPDEARFGLSQDLGTMGIWDFQAGELTDGKQSWLMVIRSDYGFKKTGSFTLDATKNDVGAPMINNPEPATLMLFAGVAAIIRHAKKKKCA